MKVETWKPIPLHRYLQNENVLVILSCYNSLNLILNHLPITAILTCFGGAISRTLCLEIIVWRRFKQSIFSRFQWSRINWYLNNQMIQVNTMNLNIDYKGINVDCHRSSFDYVTFRPVSVPAMGHLRRGLCATPLFRTPLRGKWSVPIVNLILVF